MQLKSLLDLLELIKVFEHELQLDEKEELSEKHYLHYNKNTT
jgi:hypothetical protein